MHRLLLLSLSFCALALPAQAQYYTPLSTWVTFHTQLGHLRNVTQMADNISRMNAKSGNASATAKPAKPNYAASDFKSTGTRLMLEQFVALAESENERRELRKSLRDFFNGYEKEVRKNNLGYALAFFLGANMQIATEKEISDADSELLAAECHNALVSSGMLNELSNKEKQELYELLVLTTGIVSSLYQHAISAQDDALKEQAQEIAKKSLAQFGVKFD